MEFSLGKISLGYSASEDRLTLAADAGNAGTLAFWLTLRMSRLLVQELVRFVEDTAALPAQNKETLLAFQQEAAERSNEPCAPVQPGGEAPLLVTSLNLERQGEWLTVRFPLAEENKAILTLSIAQAQQWLGILYRHFALAGWPLEGWPQWIIETHLPNAANTPQQVLH